MHLWIDNTGLHGAGRALFEEARSQYDVKGLQQLGTLLVFGDLINYGGYESHAISSASAQYRNEVVALGVPDAALSPDPTTLEGYASACEKAAMFASDELLYQFSPEHRPNIDARYPDLPRGAQFTPERTVWIATQVSDERELHDIGQHGLDQRAVGAIDYMLTSSADLRRAIAELIRSYPSWSDQDTFELEAFLRYHLNSFQARDAGALYAPAVVRAEVTNQQSDFVISSLETELSEITREIGPRHLDVPPVVRELMSRSRDDPKGFVQEAVAMREKATDLRKALRHLQVAMREDEPRGREEATAEVRELGRQVRYDLKLARAPHLFDAISFTIGIGWGLNGFIATPGLRIDPPKLRDWVARRLRSKRWSVLTDVVRGAAFGVSRPEFQRRLEARSGLRAG